MTDAACEIVTHANSFDDMRNCGETNGSFHFCNSKIDSLFTHCACIFYYKKYILNNWLCTNSVR